MVCDRPLSQTGCHGCKNETTHMPIFRIKLLFQFGYIAVQRVTDYGLHMQQVIQNHQGASESRHHQFQFCRHHSIPGWGRGGGQNGSEQCRS